MQLEAETPESKNHRLLVYGTLMRGEPNHTLLGEATLLEGPVQISGYELRASYSYYPYAFINPGACIWGEMYRVSEALLIGPIDRLEGVEEPYYTRHWDVQGQFYIYIKTEDNREDYPLIPQGDWLRYSRSKH